MAGRTALLLRCSHAEATTIRQLADAERRTVSAYVLNVVMPALHFEEVLAAHGKFPRLLRMRRPASSRSKSPKTAVLVRCSTLEAARIRAAAKRKQFSISAFIMHSLRRSWKLKSAASVTASLST